MGKISKYISNFIESATLNNQTYLYYYDKIKSLSMTMFEWKNLPESIDERFLELTLFEDGHVVFFKDEVLGFLALQCTIAGKFNVYRIPMGRRAFAVNGYNRNLSEKDSVIIYNNYLHTNQERTTKLYARRLYNYDRICDINVNAQKTPTLILCDETQRLTLKNLYMKYDGNEPVIYGDKNLDLNAVKTLKTDAPYVADKIYMLKVQYWNELLTDLGISNLNIQKKERLVSDEVIRSMGGTIASRYSRLQMRRQACDQINAMFGLDISVDYRDDFREADDETMFEGDSGEKGKTEDMVIDLRTN